MKKYLWFAAGVVVVALVLKKSNVNLGGFNPFYQGPQPPNFGAGGV